MSDYQLLLEQINFLQDALYEAGLQPTAAAVDIIREELEHAKIEGYVK